LLHERNGSRKHRRTKHQLAIAATWLEGDIVSDHTEPTTDQDIHIHNGPDGHHRPFGRRGFVARAVFLVVFAVVIAAIAFVGVSLGHHRASHPATITVTGTGKTSGAPNTMSFQAGVQTTGSSAESALDANNVKMKALEAALKRTGITKKDLQTADLNVYSNTNDHGTVISYTADDDLNVTTHQINKAGVELDAAAHAVGNDIQLSGVTFSISNQSKLLAEARANAMRNAHAEATQVAKGGGTTVTSIVRINDQENNGSTGIVVPYAQYATASSLKTSVPVQAGKQSVTVTVTVVYALAS
jgi:uncharacterized protein